MPIIEADTDPNTQRTPGRPKLLAGSAKACLIVIHGPALGRRMDLGATPLTVGRNKDATLVISHSNVSRRHCEIFKSEDGYRVRDLNATNQTRLNNVKVSEAALKDGDLLTVGESLIKFVSEQSPESGYHQQIHRLATHDTLTGLDNRHSYSEFLNQALERRRRGADRLALAVIDIDHFKRINDQWGHVAGDQVLVAIAAVLARHAQSGELVARLGGEEFAWVMPQAGLDEACAAAERLRSAVADEIRAIDGSPVTISLGVAAARPSETAEALYQRADQALYRAKQNGRNRVEPDQVADRPGG